MYACICHAVTDAEVGAAVATGSDSVRAIRRATGAGSSCGSCVKRLSCLLATYREDAVEPDPAGVPAMATSPAPPAQPAPAPRRLPALPKPAFGGHLAGCPAALALG